MDVTPHGVLRIGLTWAALWLAGLGFLVVSAGLASARAEEMSSGNAPADEAAKGVPEEQTPEPARQLPSGKTMPTDAELAEHDRANFLPVRDRWRIGYIGRWWDPYNQNVIKGDYPILGARTFLIFTGVSDTLFEARNLPTPQGVSRANQGSGDFFGRGRQLFLNQNFIFSFEVFQGDTAFRPRDWALRVTPVLNVNFLDAQEQGVVNIDVREGTTRTDHQIALQEAFLEKKLADVSRRFDFLSVRVGIQGFTSDFRGFIFSDSAPGVRFFGTLDNNRYQWNAAYFNLLEKDANSALNSFRRRHRQVVVANLYKQDFIWLGYTAQLSFHYSLDQAGTGDLNGQFYDENGFLVRPARVGDVRPHNQQSFYVGWAGEGHIGRLNVSHAFYQVLGTDDHDPFAGRRVSLNAHMAAAELSYDIDWLRPKVSLFYGSGDSKPTDGTARGFDSILDNVNFAGAGFSFFNRQGIPLIQTGVFLVNRSSLLQDLRSSKIQGQAEYVNPGTFIANIGLEMDLTPKLKAILNANYIWFVYTEPMQVVLHQPNIRHAVGGDYSLGLIYRPFLNNNVILTMSAAVFRPGPGFRDVQINETLYSTFAAATLTF